MGSFLAASAFRDVTAERLAEAVAGFAAEHGVHAEVLPGGPPDEDTQAAVFDPVDGWTVVLWPDGFNLHDVDAAQALTAALGTTASTVHVYDDDYWTHALLVDGRLADLFASRPDYFQTGPPAPALAARYAGQPATIAAATGCRAADVAAYLRHVTDDDEGRPARDGDQFTLDDPWVFTDLWHAMGITYPDHPGAAAALVDLGADWSANLPSAASEL